jgi:hypothetical protein
MKPSQRQLFSTISLRVTTEATCSRLHSALTCNPHLAKYIRAMVMGLSDLNITEPEAIVSILQNLRDQRVLRSLQFVNKDSYPLPSQLGPVLLDLFKLPCLVSLNIQAMHSVPVSNAVS